MNQSLDQSAFEKQMSSLGSDSGLVIDRSETHSQAHHKKYFLVHWPGLIRALSHYRFRPLWLRSSVVSVLLSVTAGTVPTGTSNVTLIFGTGG